MNKEKAVFPKNGHEAMNILLSLKMDDFIDGKLRDGEMYFCRDDNPKVGYLGKNIAVIKDFEEIIFLDMETGDNKKFYLR